MDADKRKHIHIQSSGAISLSHSEELWLINVDILHKTLRPRNQGANHTVELCIFISLGVKTGKGDVHAHTRTHTQTHTQWAQSLVLDWLLISSNDEGHLCLDTHKQNESQRTQKKKRKVAGYIVAHGIIACNNRITHSHAAQWCDIW